MTYSPPWSPLAPAPPSWFSCQTSRWKTLQPPVSALLPPSLPQPSGQIGSPGATKSEDSKPGCCRTAAWTVVPNWFNLRAYIYSCNDVATQIQSIKGILNHVLTNRLFAISQLIKAALEYLLSLYLHVGLLSSQRDVEDVQNLLQVLVEKTFWWVLEMACA